MLVQVQRPRYQGADGIGRWYLILQLISFAALLNNVFLLGYASDVVTSLLAVHNAATGHPDRRITSGGVLWTCILLEHVLILLKVTMHCPCPLRFLSMILPTPPTAPPLP